MLRVMSKPICSKNGFFQITRNLLTRESLLQIFRTHFNLGRSNKLDEVVVLQTYGVVTELPYCAGHYGSLLEVRFVQWSDNEH